MTEPRDTAQTMVLVLQRIIKILDEAGDEAADLELSEEDQKFVQSCLETMAAPVEDHDISEQVHELLHVVMNKM